MMPIKHIVKHAQEMRVLDIEDIGGLLEYHRRAIEVGNAFCSDCGNRWDCRIHNTNNYEESHIKASAPSLRSAVLKALEMLLEIDIKAKEKVKILEMN